METSFGQLRNPEKGTSGLGTILYHTHPKPFQQVFITCLLRAGHGSNAGNTTVNQAKPLPPES